jgi:PTS system nitrogen regulatory IIA component
MNMARRGEIPATKIGRQWRFDAALLESWLAERMAQGNGLQSLTTNYLNAESQSLSNLLAGNIKCVDDFHSKDDVLKSLSQLAHARSPEISPEHLFDALKAREQLFSTAIAGGVAFPHPRRPMNFTNGPLLALLKVNNGTDFNAPDGNPTFIFILVCSSNDRAHLRILARLTALFRSDSAVNEVKKTNSPQEILDILRRLENNIGNSNT